MLRKIAITFVLLSSTACVTRGKNFPSDTSWIRVGDTQKSDVMNLLGEPFSVGRSQNGESWTYGYYRHKLFNVSQVKELKFYWQRGGAVDSYSFNSSFPDDKLKALGTQQ